MIALEKGDMFLGDGNVLIIPCNNRAGVSASISQKLKEMVGDMDVPTLSVGEVKFPQSTNSEKIIAFAASVENVDGWSYSSPQDIISILLKIDNYAKQKNFQTVDLPLLGTGAGGLSCEIVMNYYMQYLNDSIIRYSVYVPTVEIYDRVKSFIPKFEIDNSRVFISYTGIDRNNAAWVKNLACRLIENGVNARLDLFHLSYGMDLPQWMTDEITIADKVLLICDKHYAQKANLRKGGVGWETMIIQGDMLLNQDKLKYIAICKDASIDTETPFYMKSKYSLIWNEDEDTFNNLLEFIFDINNEPALGEIPQFIRLKKQKENKKPKK